MPQTTMTFDQIETEFLKMRLEKLIQSAYEKGVKDGMGCFSYPPVLRNSHLADILQIAPTTVIKVTSNPSFPRLKNIKGRYPRDLVFEWIQENSTYLKEVV
ncbi:hypothetical protein SAMN04488137_4700 [Fictibacillus solisalsi]|uniref:Uncharacterized protein n=1 Tax=Fictibacillus solisalsi TaxID=459525 RepID=A0A1H0BYR6_9BACL|nr:hypothetical protein [Fictibacillus solisalsi]SDN50811.1 hypothetical protein SAMN04488137_4700 [Fictibacillus solisalsi]